MKQLYMKWINLIVSEHEKIEKIANTFNIDDIYENDFGSYFDKMIEIFQITFDISDNDIDLFYDILWSDKYETHVTVIDEITGESDYITVDFDEYYDLIINKEHLN